MGSESLNAMSDPSRPTPSREQWYSDWQWLAQRAPLIDQAPLPDSILEAWQNPLTEFGPVEDFFSPKTTPRTAHRVGYYNEALVHSALRGVPGVTDLQHSLPVRDGTRTLGELDFLFRCEGKVCHLEVALKFYLYSANEICLGSHYIGPNAGDTLERKTEKLLRHQLLLGKQAFPEVTESYLFCPGILFYHPEESGSDTALEHTPDFLSPNHDRGFWLRASEFGDWIAQEAHFNAGKILSKPFWMSACANQAINEVVSEIEEHFAQSRYPVALALSSTDRGDEPKRLFVVSDDWPSKP